MTTTLGAVADSPADRARRIRNTRLSRKCPCCGEELDPADEPVLQRGAVTVAFDPVAVFWNGVPLPLSPTEASVFAFIARRGRVTHAQLEAFISEIGASVGTRALVLGHIRRKFTRLGASDPFQRIGLTSLRLQVDPDGSGYRGAVIGLRLPRFAKAGS